MSAGELGKLTLIKGAIDARQRVSSLAFGPKRAMPMRLVSVFGPSPLPA
jgi:hypothetical protein